MTELERLKELEIKAVSAPWWVYKEDIGDEEFIVIPTGIRSNCKTIVDSIGGLCSENADLAEGELEANANLIVTLRNNAPALIAVVEAVKKEMNNGSNHIEDLDWGAITRTIAPFDKEVE